MVFGSTSLNDDGFISLSHTHARAGACRDEGLIYLIIMHMCANV